MANFEGRRRSRTCLYMCGGRCTQSDSGGAEPVLYTDVDLGVLDGMHSDIGTTWRVPLNRPFVVAMRPYVKLLWQLVIYCM